MNKIKQKINKILKKDKWKIYLYYNNQLIKKVYREPEFDLKENVFIVRILFKKHLFGTINTKIVCKFNKIKYYDDIKKEMHCEVDLYTGREVK